MNRIARGEHLTVPAEPLHAAVTWTAVPALPDAGALTVAALLLDARGTLRSDADLVSSQHAGHPSGPCTTWAPRRATRAWWPSGW
ncbi:hypothetical protein ACQEVS_11800 [Streptomyces sp. CA-181903]|uniref:hypothetical protein n=1 Tax=Streptomyces sp. CA-181903 TaxID=3240055 RepID=UPI003D8FBFF5